MVTIVHLKYAKCIISIICGGKQEHAFSELLGLWKEVNPLPVLSHKTNPERNSYIYCLPFVSLCFKMQFLSSTNGNDTRGSNSSQQQLPYYDTWTHYLPGHSHNALSISPLSYIPSAIT